MKPLLFLVAGVLVCGATMQAQNDAPQTTGFAPLDYFNEKCAPCHGAYGSFYGAEFGKGKSDEQLKQVVQEMGEGPAQSPLSPRDLDVLVAYHRALRDGKPFVASVKLEAGVLSGEATPGSKVFLVSAAGEPCSVPLVGHKWSAGLPEGAHITRIRVERDEKTVELEVKKDALAPK